MLRRPSRIIAALAAVALIVAAAAMALTWVAKPGDLGRVAWTNDRAAAARDAARTGKPILQFSRGSTGNALARSFGVGALSHPIVVDAAGEFVAVAVESETNAGPVLRFTDASGKDLIPPEASDISAAKVLARMVAVLKAGGRPVPAYLELVAGEYNPPARATATFAFTCYWKGETGLGGLDGVLNTRTGTLGGEEVVEVDYDPTLVAYRALAAQATGMACFRKAYTRSPDQAAAAAELTADVADRGTAGVAPADDPQHYLALYPTYHLLPLTALQATRVNAALGHGEPPEAFLSPGQIALHRRLEAVKAKDQVRLFQLEQAVKPDRSPAGLPAYAADIGRRVTAAE